MQKEQPAGSQQRKGNTCKVCKQNYICSFTVEYFEVPADMSKLISTN